MRKIYLVLIGLFSILFATEGHPYLLNWVHADVSDKKVNLKIKISAEELIYLHDVPIDSMYYVKSKDLVAIALNHASTISKNIYITDDSGTVLRSKLINQDFSDISETESIDVVQINNYSIYYVFDIEIPSEYKQLVINQTLNDTGIVSVSNLSVKKEGKIIAKDFLLDRTNPFMIKQDDNKGFLENQKHYMLSFFEISPLFITHEITIPKRTMNTFVKFESSDIDSMTHRVQEFIMKSSGVIVEDKNISPSRVIFKCHKGINDESNDDLLNITIRYPVDKFPENFELVWQKFNWQLSWFDSLIKYNYIEENHKFSKYSTRYNSGETVDQ